MSLNQHVIELFHSSIDVTMRTLDEQASQVADAGALITQCLLSDNKLLCCGEGISGVIGQTFCTHMLNRFNYERPSLPAINLSCDAVTLMALAADNKFKNIFSHQIRALGQTNDILFLISNGNDGGTSLQAIKAAHDREMVIICINGQSSNDFSALLQPEDIEISIPSDDHARISEVQLQIINYLSELIDQQLFGSH